MAAASSFPRKSRDPPCCQLWHAASERCQCPDAHLPKRCQPVACQPVVSRCLATMQLFSIDEDVAATVLSHLPLASLPPAIRSLRLTCTTGNRWLSRADVIWKSLEASLPSTAAASASSSFSKAAKLSSLPSTVAACRRSSRLALVSAEQSFVRTWRLLLQRSEALHHAIAYAGQDSKDLGVQKLRGAFGRWGPLQPLIDRASPVYNATLLMECCRGRGVRESNLSACAERLIFVEGADPSARPPGEAGCSPLIIAASRGLPRLTAFLLACGADVTPAGEGRFRLCGRAQSIFGVHRASTWVALLLQAEEAAGIDVEHRRGLMLCQRLLLRAEDRRRRRQLLESGPQPPQPPSDAPCKIDEEMSGLPSSPTQAKARAAILLKEASSRAGGSTSASAAEDEAALG